MRLATIAQAQQLDRVAQSDYGLSAEILMEAAGALAAREIDQFYQPELRRGTVVVVCGPGHNGGDGLVVARHLHASGQRDLEVILLAPRESGAALMLRQLKRARMQGVRILDASDQADRVSESLAKAELIVDALFGIGLNRPLEKPYSDLVEQMNGARAPIVALDTPSGLNADTGVVGGGVVKAAMTLTFGLAKPGFFTADGPRIVGRLRILPIGFPFEATRSIATSHFLFTERLARRYLPRRLETGNKSDFGHLLLVAGRAGMWGAGLLAGHAAYRMGVGYVTWGSFGVPGEEWLKLPEALTLDLRAHPEPWLERKHTAVAVGPGLGFGEETVSLIRRLKATFPGPVIVDADAITACAQAGLWPLPRHWVVTPHTGELARVMGGSAQELERDRFGAAHRAARMMGAHVLLKGYRSILADGARSMVIHAGNSALAKAGTGDVLTGMIGALLAQRLETVQATATAAWIHGKMADEWVRLGLDQRALSASDIGEQLPQLLARISGATFA